MFKMSFDFEDRELNGLNFVNAALVSMRLSDLKAENCDGYLAVRIEYDPETQKPIKTTYHYGFDHLTLVCNADEDEELHTWQVDTIAFSKGEVSDSKAFQDRWRKEHPDRVMRTLMKYALDDEDAFVVLHHERTGNSNIKCCLFQL